MKRNLDLLIYKYRMIIMLLLVIIGFSLAALLSSSASIR